MCPILRVISPINLTKLTILRLRRCSSQSPITVTIQSRLNIHTEEANGALVSGLYLPLYRWAQVPVEIAASVFTWPIHILVAPCKLSCHLESISNWTCHIV